MTQPKEPPNDRPKPQVDGTDRPKPRYPARPGRPRNADRPRLVAVANNEPKKRGRPKGPGKRYSVNAAHEVAAALIDAKGLISVAAETLGISPQAVRARCGRDPELAEVLAQARETMKDRAESKLFDSIEAREAWAICFYLKTQAKDRGYIERSELANAPGENFEVTVQAVPWRTALEPFLPPGDDQAADGS